MYFAIFLFLLFFFFFNDTSTTEIYTLSLHDALPIYPEPAQRHRAHASGIERSPGHFKKSGGGVGSRKQLSQGHPPQSVDCPCRQRAGLSCRPRRRGDPCALEGGPPEGAAG